MKGLLSGNGRCHNFRSLTKGLQSFYRIYYHIDSEGLDVPDGYLYSFLAYYLASKSGIFKDGVHTLEVDNAGSDQ